MSKKLAGNDVFIYKLSMDNVQNRQKAVIYKKKRVENIANAKNIDDIRLVCYNKKCVGQGGVVCTESCSVE